MELLGGVAAVVGEAADQVLVGIADDVVAHGPVTQGQGREVLD